MKHLSVLLLMLIAFDHCSHAEELLLPYSSYLGGTNNDYATAIAVDSLKDIYVTGRTASTNFPVTNAIQSTYSGGAYDIFLTKFTSNGSVVVYSTYLGGSGDDRPYAIDTCPDGSVCISGYTTSTNFPVTNAYQSVHSGGNDAFVIKIAPSGTSLVYSTYLGGTDDDSGDALHVITNGTVFIAGTTSSTNFPTVTPYQANNAGGKDIFAAKLSPTGTNLLYSTYFGGSGDNDLAEGITVDAIGQIYIAGHTDSSDFPTSAPMQSVYGGGTHDAVVSCLSSNGNSLRYSTYLGGSSSDYGMDIALDSETNAYITGYTRSADFPTLNPYMASITGAYDNAFLTKLSPQGNQLIYSTFLGGTWYNFAYAVAVDPVGQAYVAGRTSSTNFPTVTPYQDKRAGSPLIPYYDAFVTKFSLNGGGLVYSTYLGGEKSESGIQMDIDSIDKVYLVGETRSSGFPTNSPYQGSHGGGYTDAFLSEFDFLMDLQFLRIRNTSSNALIQWGGGPATTQRLMHTYSLIPTQSWTCVSTTLPPYKALNCYTTSTSEAEMGFYRIESP